MEQQKTVTSTAQRLKGGLCSHVLESQQQIKMPCVIVSSTPAESSLSPSLSQLRLMAALGWVPTANRVVVMIGPLFYASSAHAPGLRAAQAGALVWPGLAWTFPGVQRLLPGRRNRSEPLDRTPCLLDTQ